MLTMQCIGATTTSTAWCRRTCHPCRRWSPLRLSVGLPNYSVDEAWCATRARAASDVFTGTASTAATPAHSHPAVTLQSHRPRAGGQSPDTPCSTVRAAHTHLGEPCQCVLAGIGRAPAVALAYMWWVQGRHLESAHKDLLAKRKCVPKLHAIREATADMLFGAEPQDVVIRKRGSGNSQSVEIAGARLTPVCAVTDVVICKRGLRQFAERVWF